MTTINDISDLLRILRERPEWLKAVREIVLTEELLRLPETIAQLAEELREYARQTNERLERLETDVAGLKTDMTEVKTDIVGMKANQESTDRRLGRMENQINEMRGDILEITAAKRIIPSVIKQMSLYDCDTIIGPGMILSQDRINDIRLSERAGVVGRGASQEVALVDLLLHGRRDDDEQAVWVVVEASVKIDEHDIRRAGHRAGILTAVYHEPALAVVVGESIDDRDNERASASGVTVIMMRPRHRAEA